MYGVHLKSPKQLQAQVAAFAAEWSGDFNEKRYLYDILGSLASSTVYSGWDEKTVAEYRSFLHHGSQYEPIRARTALLERYDDTFRPIVSELCENLEQYSVPDEHPDFIGRGGESEVFRIRHEGEEYAVRIPYQEATEVVEKHIAGGLLGRGVPHLEQIVAASYEDGVTVSSMMHGKVMTHRTAAEMRAVPEVHVDELIDTLVTAHRLGIALDPNFSNVIYNEKSGFDLIDYKAAQNQDEYDVLMSEGQHVGYAITALMNRGVYEQKNRYNLVTITHANTLEWDLANIELYKRMRRAVSKKLSAEYRDEALRVIDSRLLAYEAGISEIIHTASRTSR